MSWIFKIEALESRRLLSGAGLFLSDQDIGSPAQAGSFAYSDGAYTMTGGGADIGGSSDQFHFAYNPFAGDGNIAAIVTSISNTDSAAKAGVMLRSSISATAAFAGVFETPGTGIAFVVRTADGATAGSTTVAGFAAPRYVRLSRTGAQVSAFSSGDGVTWTQVGSTQTISFGSSPLAGLAVTARNNAALATGTFAGASVLASGWNDIDIGTPPLRGSGIFHSDANAFDTTGSGSDIGGTSDQFNFLNRSMTGGGSVIARVDSLADTDPNTKGGVMIRDSSAANAIFASALVTAEQGIVFEWRTTTGVAASAAMGPAIGAPVWLKITQLTGSFSAYYSSDGANWNQIGATQSLSVTSATTLAGLALTSHNNSALSTAAFSGVSVLPAGISDADIGAPSLAGSATYDPPSDTYTLAASGADIYGTSDQFNLASRSMSGDGSVVTFVNSILNTDPWAKAGVMLRVDSTAASAFAGLFVSAQNGIVFEWRPSSGAAVQQGVSVPVVNAPVSLKLVRAGNSFSAYFSTDGVNFTLVGPAQSVTMPASVLAGLALTSHNSSAICVASFTGFTAGTSLPPGAGIYSASDESFLDDLERREVDFFYSETNPATGLVPDGALANGGSNGSASSIASLGFGLTALTIGDQRGWISHSNAYQRALTTVNFLYNTAAQVQGFYYHFLNTTTGARSGNSELSSIDTAELMAGVLNVAQYWPGTQVQTVATNIFNRVNWPFMQKPNGQFYGAWVPEGNQFSGGYVDFSEAVLLYLLALGSPTHPTAQSSWLSWSRTPVRTYGSYTFVTASDSALFTVQYPQAWFDMRGLTDSTGLSYYPNAQTATLAQRQWSADHNSTWSDYTLNMWGLTASDGKNGYTVWGAPPAFGPIDGTVVPTAPGGSLAFTPRQSVDVLKNMYTLYSTSVYKKYGLIDAFNPLNPSWASSIVLGIDVGMTLIAAENSRSDFVWNVFSQNPVARQSLAQAFPSLKPTLLSALSRKTNDFLVSQDMPVDLTGRLTVENRNGGPTELLLTFEANIIKGPGFAIGLSSGSVSGSFVNGQTLTIDLSGAIDEQALQVSITDMRHYSTSAGGNYTFSLGVLLGDANQDEVVDTIDFNVLAANFGQGGKDSSQGDFNYSGTVDTIDFNLLVSNFSKALAAPPATLLDNRSFSSAVFDILP